MFNENEHPLENQFRKEKWLRELENSKAVQKYLDGYNSKSTKGFLEFYVRQKETWFMQADINEKVREHKELLWINNAFEHLKIILQKKLFDIQCLWRAEKIQISGIDICEDFIFWEKDILNCPFTEPLNENDIELYTAYLMGNTAVSSTEDIIESWQDHKELKGAYDEKDSDRFPAWYNFHNERTATGDYMLLPDIRGDKEDFYLDLHFKNMQKQEEERGMNRKKKEDDRPSFNQFQPETIRTFVHLFEKGEALKFFGNYDWVNRNEEKEDRILEITNELMDADEHVPIDAHDNWFEALESTLNTYRCRKIAEALPAALEQYQMTIQLGIGFPKENTHGSVRKVYVENILSGRRLNGDPEDLNF